MNCTKYLCLALLLGALAGCGDKKPTDDKKPDSSKDSAKKSGDKKDKKDDEHEHGPGPNGGTIFDLGKDHAEFTVYRDKKECVVLMIDGHDAKAKLLAVAATELTLTTKATKAKDGKDVPALTVTLKPTDAKDGKATKFVGAHAEFAREVAFEGVVVGEIDKKPAEGDFKQ
jgi:predicted small lipoprotein YifL